MEDSFLPKRTINVVVTNLCSDSLVVIDSAPESLACLFFVEFSKYEIAREGAARTADGVEKTKRSSRESTNRVKELAIATEREPLLSVFASATVISLLRLVYIGLLENRFATYFSTVVSFTVYEHSKLSVNGRARLAANGSTVGRVGARLSPGLDEKSAQVESV
ncbi:hypothetical protein EVAR_97134_1 [Eumeta japonica]|uniref:Uncharacterized protein n=1 Tax=Eumeta variegata TaxID=151549 RepID=A0A4C1WQJ6_EUMVA|nr:hypothetical protein EVAR_97134_1 [Eumeta japonica]